MSAETTPADRHAARRCPVGPGGTHYFTSDDECLYCHKLDNPPPMTGVELMNEFLRHAVAHDLPLADLLDLKAAAFDACAADSRQRGDTALADAEEAAAAHARAAAETERRT